jgi:hypothetical protein
VEMDFGLHQFSPRGTSLKLFSLAMPRDIQVLFGPNNIQDEVTVDFF